MKGLDEFIQVFGGVTVGTVITGIIAIAFLIAGYMKFRAYLLKKHDLEVAKSRELKEALEAVRKYPEYRAQSVEIQNQLAIELQEIKRVQEDCISRLSQIEEDNRRRERNKLRDLLLQNYRYYINSEHNPERAWTRMESDAFWDMFHEYELAGGDGYMHTTVQQEMSTLIVIDMNDIEHITSLMRSRR